MMRSKPPLDDKILKIMFDLLIEVYPKHIDEFGFYDKNKHLLLTVFPALKAVHKWYTFDHEKETLQKSDYLIKKQHETVDVKFVKVHSEEVSLTKELQESI